MAGIAGLWVVAASLAAGCGGRTDASAEPGPRQGFGLYELVIERVADDCVPALPSGRYGPHAVAVSVAGSADAGVANIPVPQGLDGGEGFIRQDVVFSKSAVSEIPLTVPGCSATLHMSLATLAVNSAQIDIEWKSSFRGLEMCRVEAGRPARDCSSHRILHFRWLASCPDGNLSVCLDSEDD